ncbi:hypothetical protein C8J27_101429 [Rhodobacter aestuarii]|uniref:Uncharacterized protein n=1 Tax=Rhodobacter aestuarii TaxID=453582 RepID=A0A1N7J0N6_9RHOB|nr:MULTISPECIES: hypothetical protein [Rhodobacter]PTV97317.1 hypothetical protein C8J27_101429 [Rhodobacter aestuarii]SIS42844.1 hypothetical protein SAMN05421580_101213 [Rhodobacter aestuarii]SOB99748.1 hypothetical protein SAMN05877809_102497 [Rhodobacter sp. JA431]
MTSRSPDRELPFGKFEEHTCPYCGAPLIYRKDFRDHLTLKVCCHQAEGKDPWPYPYPRGFDGPGADDEAFEPRHDHERA